MNLLEWKQYQTQTFREELKKQMMNGVSHDTHFLFSEEQLDEIKQEIEIEQFEETVSFDGELEIDRPLIEGHSEIQEVLDFVPDEDGSVMDLVFEFDLNEIDPSINGMNALRELLFAEEYEFVTEEELADIEKAKDLCELKIIELWNNQDSAEFKALCSTYFDLASEVNVASRDEVAIFEFIKPSINNFAFFF